MMTGILLVGFGWEWGYGIVAAPFIVLSFGFIATRSRWSTTQIHEEDESQEVAAAGTFETLRVPGVWMGISAFVLHTALEVAAGVWSFTLLTEARGLSVGSAGVWVTAYFGGLVAGRIALVRSPISCR